MIINYGHSVMETSVDSPLTRSELGASSFFDGASSTVAMDIAMADSTPDRAAASARRTRAEKNLPPLLQLFEEAAETELAPDVDDALVCNIGLTWMTDPVVTTAGHTYVRS